MGRFLFLSLGLLVVAFSLQGSGADCPSDWSSYDKYCYKVFEQRKNWEDAERSCVEQGREAHLVSVGSSEEANFIGKLTWESLKEQPTFVWIGRRDPGHEQQCSSSWSDGSSIVYENWLPLQSRKCVTLSKWTQYRRWYNNYCSYLSPFVCKFLADPVEDPAPE